MSVKAGADVLRALDRAERRLKEVESDLVRTRAWATSVLRPDAAGVPSPSHDEDPALKAFVETTREVLGDRPVSVRSARRAALIAVSEEAWEDELGPLLSSAHVRHLLGDVSRQRIDELLKAHRLIGLSDSSSRRRFPAFQFHEGRTIEALVEAFWTMTSGLVSGWSAAAWCTARHDELDERTPAAWAKDGADPERLLLVAGRDALRLSR